MSRSGTASGGASRRAGRAERSSRGLVRRKFTKLCMDFPKKTGACQRNFSADFDSPKISLSDFRITQSNFGISLSDSGISLFYFHAFTPENSEKMARIFRQVPPPSEAARLMCWKWADCRKCKKRAVFGTLFSEMKKMPVFEPIFCEKSLQRRLPSERLPSRAQATRRHAYNIFLVACGFFFWKKALYLHADTLFCPASEARERQNKTKIKTKNKLKKQCKTKDL